jgi:glutaredoxin
MWAIRNGRTGKFLETTSLQLETVQNAAKLYSQNSTNRMEVIELETMRVPYVYINGQEFISSREEISFHATNVSDEAAEALGKQIWQDLAARQLVLERLLSKLTLSTHEEKQFELTQDKVAERQSELSLLLTDAEYQCAYYTFVGSLRRREFAKPNYCERQIRRYTKKALIKTGQVAFDEEWKPIRLMLNNDNSITKGHSEGQSVHST